GLYSAFGLQRLAMQLGARAKRNHEAFACVAISAEPDRHPLSERLVEMETVTEFADVAHVLRDQSRKSDVVARVGPERFAILAPDTKGDAVPLMVQRLQRELDKASRDLRLPTHVRLRAGY